MTNFDDESTIVRTFYLCDCSQHAVAASYIDDNDGLPPTISVEWWVYGSVLWTWRERLRYAWHVLRYGRLLAHEVILSTDNAHDMGKQLQGFAAMAQVRTE